MALRDVFSRGASLASRLYRNITAGLIPSSETKQTVPQRIAEIERKSGSGRKAAAAVGVPESTWRGWRKGTPPGPAGVEKIEQAQRRVRLAPGREQRLNATLGKNLIVKADLIVSNEEGSERKFRASDYFTEDDNKAIIAAYLSGDDEKLEQAFTDALDSYYPGDWSNVEITWKQ